MAKPIYQENELTVLQMITAIQDEDIFNVLKGTYNF